MELPRAVGDTYELRKHLHEIHSLAERDSAAALRRFNEIFYPENVENPELTKTSEQETLTMYIADAMVAVHPCRLRMSCRDCPDNYNGRCLMYIRTVAAELLRRGVKLPTEE